MQIDDDDVPCERCSWVLKSVSVTKEFQMIVSWWSVKIVKNVGCLNVVKGTLNP